MFAHIMRDASRGFCIGLLSIYVRDQRAFYQFIKAAHNNRDSVRKLDTSVVPH